MHLINYPSSAPIKSYVYSQTNLAPTKSSSRNPIPAISPQAMLSLSSAASAFRPADPAARGATSPSQQRSLPHATTAAQRMLALSSAVPFRSPADLSARGAIASQQQQRGLPRATTAAAAIRPADQAARGSTKFDHYVVIDFEATCERDSRIYPQEIIEFPAVLVDAATGRLVSSFRTYVRPKHHPRLTAFCTELTGIQQDEVDGGVDLAKALAMHDSWLTAAGASKNSLAVVTWGDWDCRIMLESECTFKAIPKPAYFDRWVNLRVPFEAAFGAGRRNLQEAVREAGLQWKGRLHCGLDDARNTAYLLAELMRRGVTISITGSLAPPPQPQPEPETEQQPQLQSQLHHLQLQSQTLLQPQQLPMNHNLSYCISGVYATESCCYCGVAIRRGLMATPGPMQGQSFFICRNWTPALGPMCPFFLWA